MPTPIEPLVSASTQQPGATPPPIQADPTASEAMRFALLEAERLEGVAEELEARCERVRSEFQDLILAQSQVASKQPSLSRSIAASLSTITAAVEENEAQVADRVKLTQCVLDLCAFDASCCRFFEAIQRRLGAFDCRIDEARAMSEVAIQAYAIRVRQYSDLNHQFEQVADDCGPGLQRRIDAAAEGVLQPALGAARAELDAARTALALAQRQVNDAAARLQRCQTAAERHAVMALKRTH